MLFYQRLRNVILVLIDKCVGQFFHHVCCQEGQSDYYVLLLISVVVKYFDDGINYIQYHIELLILSKYNFYISFMNGVEGGGCDCKL